MASCGQKRLKDLPQFSVSGVKEEGSAPDGYIPLELSGSFDTLEGVREGRCWLLLPDKQSLIGDLTSPDTNAKTAFYRTFDRTVPALVGHTLPYLNGYWQAYHVWMVMDADQVSQELVFRPSDAVSFSCDGSGGRELKGIRKTSPEDLLNPDLQIVRNGWDHEHCELCNAHINPGDSGYQDAEGGWVCQRCYSRYVRPHDLAFIDEL